MTAEAQSSRLRQTLSRRESDKGHEKQSHEAFFSPAPPARLAVLRLCTGIFSVLYLVLRGPHWLDISHFDSTRFLPIGVLFWLSSPLPALVFQALTVLCLLTGIAYTTGWRFRVTGPLFGLLLLLVTTYRNSWGQIFHSENLMVLHVLVIGFAPAADVCSSDRRRSSAPVPLRAFRYGWPVRLLALITVLTYLVAGLAKLHNAGFSWATGDVLLHQVAFDNMRKDAFGTVYSPLGAALVAHHWVFPPMALGSLFVELGAPLAGFSSSFARIWVPAAWLFHVGVLAFMAIVFPYPLFGVAFAAFYRVERLLEWRLLAPLVRHWT